MTGRAAAAVRVVVVVVCVVAACIFAMWVTAFDLAYYGGSP